MNSRETILQRIRGALDETRTSVEAPPPVAEVWPRTTSDPAALAARFADELKEVHGEVIRCTDMEEAARRLAELIEQSQWSAIVAVEHPLVDELVGGLPAERVVRPDPAWKPADMAPLAAGLVGAEKLLADTGSCIVACRTPQQRMACYLPPACVVVARVEQIAEHLPAAWGDLVPLVADKEARGELVVITGPSRTADIEKILILGVHGPKRLVVLLVGSYTK
jgi:L-lactate dehydrogenase complex protein LldG